MGGSSSEDDKIEITNKNTNKRNRGIEGKDVDIDGKNTPLMTMSLDGKVPSLDGKVPFENNSDHILKKLDFIHINNGWNDHNEKIIISIGEN